MPTVGINGFGRIGRICLRICLDRGLEIKHINDPYISANYMIYLFKYDTSHGIFDKPVGCDQGGIFVNERRITTSQEKEPWQIQWIDFGVDYVIETTGIYTTLEKAKQHLEGGARYVIITSPSTDAPTFVYGVNHREYDPSRCGICVISTASSTTNCAAPIISIMHKQFGVEEAMITAIHAVTPNQNILDGPSSKLLRDGRSGMNNIIPTSTGATRCIGKVIPDLKDKITAISFCVPVTNVSVCDITCRMTRPMTYENLKRAMKHAAENELKNVLGYTEDECVSSDFSHTSYSCIFDATATIPQTSSFVKVVAWYDNEYGYANRILDLLTYISDVNTRNLPAEN